MVNIIISKWELENNKTTKKTIINQIEKLITRITREEIEQVRIIIKAQPINQYE